MDNQSVAKERWYYAEGEAVNGPFSPEELLKKAEDGLLNSDTLVVPEGREDWRPFATLALNAKSRPNSPDPQGPKPSAQNGVGTSLTKLEHVPTSEAFDQSRVTSRTALQAFAGLIALLVACIALWHYWQPLLLLSTFLGIWYWSASSGLKAGRSRTLSVGGGFILGLLALMLTVKLFGGHEKEKQPLTATEAKEGMAQDAQVSEQPPVATESLTHLLGLSRYGRLDMAELKKTLITADGSAYPYVVESTTSDYVFYHLAHPSQFNGLAAQFAVVRGPNQFYPEGSRFRGKRFRVVGMETFTTVAGAGKDLLVLRPDE